MKRQLLVSDAHLRKINRVDLTAPSIIFPEDSWWICRLVEISGIENIICVINRGGVVHDTEAV